MRKRIGLMRAGMELKDESEELDDGDRIRAKVIGVDLVFEKQ